MTTRALILNLAAVLLALLLVVSPAAHATPDWTQEEVQVAQKALEDGEAGRHKASCEGWRKLRSSPTIRDDLEAQQMIDTLIMMQVSLAIVKEVQVTEDIDSYWLARAEELGPPSSSEYHFDHGIMRLVEAAYYQKEKQRSKAQAKLAEAEAYLSSAEKAGYDDAALLAWSKEVRTKVRGFILQDGFSVGDYVATPGGYQSWIGRIVAIDGQRFTVRVTYCNSSRYQVGQDTSFLRDEIAPLTMLSVDAVLQGWH